MPAQIYYAEPTLEIDGKKDSILGANIVSVLVEETIQGLYRCEVRLSNSSLDPQGPKYLYFQRDILDFGKNISIGIGSPANTKPVFEGVISAIEGLFTQAGQNQIVVLAEDALQKLRMARHSRTFQNITDADAIKEIASKNGLAANIMLEGPIHNTLLQLNQSDLAFIRERVRQLGGEVWVEKKTLHIKPRSQRKTGQLELDYGDNLFSFRVKADLTSQYSEIGYSGWDVKAKEAIDEAATSGDIKGTIAGETGSKILLKSIGERAERVVHAVPLTSEEAKAYAKARFNEYANRFVTGTGLCDGNPDIRVGKTVNLKGLGGLFNGEYYVVEARHTFDRWQGYRTTFEVERPYIGKSANQGD